MFKYKASIVLLASAMLMLPGAAIAQNNKGQGATTTTAASKGGAVTAEGLVERYGSLIGHDNAKSLVSGLRNKAEVVLVGPSLAPPCTSRFGCNGGAGNGTITLKFIPPTDAMGLGNIDIALALMEADLKAKSAVGNKPEYVKATLTGGKAGSLTFEGILALRAAGNGWGEIAKSLGFQLK